MVDLQRSWWRDNSLEHAASGRSKIETTSPRGDGNRHGDGCGGGRPGQIKVREQLYPPSVGEVFGMADGSACICASCLQEKLGMLDSSSQSNPSHPLSVCRPPSLPILWPATSPLRMVVGELTERKAGWMVRNRDEDIFLSQNGCWWADAALPPRRLAVRAVRPRLPSRRASVESRSKYTSTPSSSAAAAARTSRALLQELATPLLAPGDPNQEQKFKLVVLVAVGSSSVRQVDLLNFGWPGCNIPNWCVQKFCGKTLWFVGCLIYYAITKNIVRSHNLRYFLWSKRFLLSHWCLLTRKLNELARATNRAEPS